ncbi:MAG TPA: phosphotransferase [Alphaproteobacteria bacterium]|nr:phosphotransferase [Alphaproteobacteria bacterium]
MWPPFSTTPQDAEEDFPPLLLDRMPGLDKAITLGKGFHGVACRYGGTVYKIMRFAKEASDAKNEKMRDLISAHFHKEVSALTALRPLAEEGFVPALIDCEWFKNPLFLDASPQRPLGTFITGFLSMTAVQGASYVAGKARSPRQKAAIYRHMGAGLARFHKAAAQVDLGKIEHCVHEHDARQAHDAINSAANRHRNDQRKKESKERNGLFFEETGPSKKIVQVYRGRDNYDRARRLAKSQELAALHRDIMAQKDDFLLLHGDAKLDNFLYRERWPHRLFGIHEPVQAIGVVDFGHSGRGLPEYDFVVREGLTEVSMGMGVDFDAAIIEGYVKAGGPYNPERHALVRSMHRAVKEALSLA